MVPATQKAPECWIPADKFMVVLKTACMNTTDRRKGSPRLVSRRLTDEQRQWILHTCNEPELTALPRGRSCRSWRIGASTSVQSAASTGCCMPMTRPIAGGGLAHRLRVDGPNQLWSWDISDIPTCLREVWLYLYLVIQDWRRAVVAWYVAEREDAQIAAEPVGRACQRERISCRRPRLMILHDDDGKAMGAAPLQSRLEALGVLRSFSRPRVSNDNPYSESLFLTVKDRPDYPRGPFRSVKQACSWVAAFEGWYNDRHRDSGQADAICQKRVRVYEQVRQRHPHRWSHTARCRHEPEAVWINPPPQETASLRLSWERPPDRRQERLFPGSHRGDAQGPQRQGCDGAGSHGLNKVVLPLSRALGPRG